MCHVRIIAMGQLTVQVSDGQGNMFPLYFNEFLLSKLVTERKITFKRSTPLWDDDFTEENIFSVTIDVIEALLADDIDGVILIDGQELVSEFAFYISLFTMSYHKPIIFYSLANNHQGIVFSKRSSSGKEIFYMPALRKGLHLVTKWQDQSFIPLIINDHQINPVFGDQSADMHQGKGIEKAVNKSFIQKLSFAHQMIGRLPVIPKKVIILPISLEMQGDEILNIAKHCAGIVFEIASLQQMSSSLRRAIECLINFRLPIIIVEKCRRVLKYGKDRNNLYEWTVHQLTSRQARILLGIMIAQKMTFDQMKQIYKIFR